MKVAQAVLRDDVSVDAALSRLAALAPQLVLAFGSVSRLQRHAAALRTIFPEAHFAGCSTAGEISAGGVADDSLVVTALHFNATRVVQATTTLQGMADSRAAGQRMAQGFDLQGLRAVMVFGQGVEINGSAMLEGMIEVLGPDIPITGGLAGDGGAFAQTWVLCDAGLSERGLVCIGFYGEKLVFSHGSYGGWSPFGPARKVTRSEHNVLYALDGESALAVYKRYLGEHAKGLPASGLLFPFAMLGRDHNEIGLIRTILAVDEATGSLTLAGDIDPNGYLKLMHASTDALVDGAEAAAQAAHVAYAARQTASAVDAAKALAPVDGSLAVLVSCVGRKLVMGGRVDEEVEAVADVFGKSTTLTGFYSYGEISPFTKANACKLHNQTMTVTYLAEA